jgi:hypothetical protein
MDGGGVHGRGGEDVRAARRQAARDRRRSVRRRRAVALAALAAAVAIGLAAFGGGQSPGSRPRGAAAATAAAGATGQTAGAGATRQTAAAGETGQTAGAGATRQTAGAGATGQSAAAGAGGDGAAGTRSGHTSDARSGRTRTGAARRAAAPSPGSLPQTHAYPSGTSAQFRALMASLWGGVAHDSLAQALPAFFPEKAYVQLKAIVAAGSDWSDRLVHDYGLDLTAAHRLLGRDAGRARLLAVNVVSSYGHWISPGVCDNGIGYYEMPNARVVYREDGQVHSFGIASMISWRGVWYVVHFGAILRATDAGTVDAPAGGPGVSAYSGTC